MEENTVEQLVNQLSNIPSWMLDSIIFKLIESGNLKYEHISNIYVEHLRNQQKEFTSQITEASTCVAQAMMDGKFSDKNVTDRCIRLLDRTEVYLTDGLKKKYKYDEKNGTHLSHYDLEI